MKTFTVTVQYTVEDESIAGAAATAENIAKNFPGATVVSVEETSVNPA